MHTCFILIGRWLITRHNNRKVNKKAHERRGPWFTAQQLVPDHFFPSVSPQLAPSPNTVIRARLEGLWGSQPYISLQLHIQSDPSKKKGGFVFCKFCPKRFYFPAIKESLWLFPWLIIDALGGAVGFQIYARCFEYIFCGCYTNKQQKSKRSLSFWRRVVGGLLARAQSVFL